MDLGGLQRFLEDQLWQDGRQPPGEHGFATAGRADHQEIMTACCSHLQSTLDVGLAAHFGEIEVIGDCLTEQGVDIGPVRFQGGVVGQKIDQLAQCSDRKHRQVVHQAAFTSVLRRQDQAVNIPITGRHRHRQHTANRLDATVQGEFPHVEIALGPLDGDHPGGGQQTDRHRQVEGRAILADIGRRQVNGDPAVGKIVAGVFDSGFDAVLAFLDRAFRQADRGKLRQTLGDVDFDLDTIRIDADQRPGQNPGEHKPLLCQ